MTQFRLSLAEYVGRQWRAYLSLGILAALTFGFAAVLGEGSTSQEISVNIAAGILSLFLFQVLTDYKNLEFTGNLLQHFQLTVHTGAILHQDHHAVLSRADSIRSLLSKHDTLRLLTSTADDYLLADKSGHHVLCEKLKEGCKLQILLFTPVFNLKSFVDSKSQPRDGGGESEAIYGQRHRHASALIKEHIDTIIPAIRRLQQKYPQKVEVRFFKVKHHVNMAIYGTKRVFAAPLMSGTEGRELPCLEVFPGLGSARLFEKMSAEFNYLWEREKLLFMLDEIEEVYTHISHTYPSYLLGQYIDSVGAGQIEEVAEAVVKRRLSQAAVVTKKSPRKRK